MTSGDTVSQRTARARNLSTLSFSMLSAYLLSFVFEGQVLYSLSDHFEVPSTTLVFPAIMAHFVGLFGCGFVVKTPGAAKRTMLCGIGISLLFSIPFLFPAPHVWTGSLVVCALASGCAVAAWGYFLRSLTPKNMRIKTCADVLIYSNILMILINLAAIHLSPGVGLSLSMLMLVLAGTLTGLLPVAEWPSANDSRAKVSISLKRPVLLLCLFVVVLTINSGLMYQVFNPAFAHLTWLTSWYWAVPYIAGLAAMRNLPVRAKRSYFLYAGMTMIMLSFIFFMLLDRSATSYFVVDTLMLGACGIFDLFWWSIIGEMLEYSRYPVRTFGVCISANVLGVLLGGLIGSSMTSSGIPDTSITVIALSVICVTLVILPPLNRQLVMLLKSHTYLLVYSDMAKSQQRKIVSRIQALDPLTGREQDVLQLLLSGKTNKDIAAELVISENTVKTHVRNIYSKYDVSSRAELISTLLKNQIRT